MKLFHKLAVAFVGASMAIGVGVVAAKNSSDVVPAKAASSATSSKITIDCSSNGDGWVTSSSDSENTITVGDFVFGYKACYFSSSYVMMSKSAGVIYNKTAIPNISSISFTYSSDTSEKAKVLVNQNATAITSRQTSGYTDSLDVAKSGTKTTAGTYTNQYVAFSVSNANNIQVTKIEINYTAPSGPSLSIDGSSYLVDGGSAKTFSGTITNNSSYTITWSASPSTGVTISPTTSSSGGDVSISFDGVTTGTTPVVITATLNDTNTTSKSMNVYALEHAGTSTDPFDATDAMVFAHADYAAQSGGDWYVGGYVVGTYSTKGYYIDEEKTATSSPYKFEVFNNGGLPTTVDGKTITVGTSYIVAHGSMTYYESGEQAEISSATIVSVDNGNVPSVSITEGDQSIYLNDPLTFHATTEHAGDVTVSWSSSDESVATIGANTGVVTTVGGGTTTITASITVNLVEYTNSVTLEVTAPLLKNGDSVIFYSGEVYLTDINTGSSTHYGNKTDTKASAVVYTVEAGSAANSYAFSHSGNYLTWSSGNSLDYANSVTANSSWSITGDSLTDCTIKNVADSTRLLKYNSSFPRFACYQSGQNAVSIEKLIVPDPTTLSLDTKTLSLEAEEVSNALTFTTDSPSASFHWYSENTSKATVVNGVVTAGTQTDISVKIYVYFDTDESGDFDPAEDLNDYCTVTIVAPTIDYTAVSYGGTGVKITSSNASTYLANGKKIILTYNDEVVAGAYGSYIPATSTSVTFDSDEVTIGNGTAEVAITVLELESATGGFYLKTKDGKYLSHTSTDSSTGNFAKTDLASTIWSVTADGIYATDNQARATIRYNTTASPTRFKTYTPGTGAAIVLYSFVEYVDEAETYADLFLESGLCGANDNTKADSATWLELEDTFENDVSAGAQNVLKNATANKDSSDSIQKCLARYDRVIYLHYGTEPLAYPDFMDRVANSFVTPKSNTFNPLNVVESSNGTALIITIISVISLTAVGAYFLLKKKHA